MGRLSNFATAIALILASVPCALATDLGNATSFGVLSLGGAVVFGTDSALSGGDVGGRGIILRANATVTGDLIASPNGINMKTGSGADGCITAGAQVIQATGNNCSNVDTTGSNSEVTTLLPQAISDAANFVAAAKATTATQVFTHPIRIAASDSFPITDNVSGLNIITVPSVIVRRDAALTFSGASSDEVVLIIAGNLKMGHDTLLAPSLLGPNFPESHLVILVLGKLVSVGKNAVLNGTLLAPKAHCTLGAGFATRGAFICGHSIALSNEDGAGDSGSIVLSPSTVTLP
jgi:hypothetical protein